MVIQNKLYKQMRFDKQPMSSVEDLGLNDMCIPQSPVSSTEDKISHVLTLYFPLTPCYHLPLTTNYPLLPPSPYYHLNPTFPLSSLTP